MNNSIVFKAVQLRIVRVLKKCHLHEDECIIRKITENMLFY